MDSRITHAALYTSCIGDLRPTEANHHGCDVVRRDFHRSPEGGIFRNRDHHRPEFSRCTEQLKICGSGHLIIFGIDIPGRRMRHHKTGGIAEKCNVFCGKTSTDAFHLFWTVNKRKFYGLPVSVIWCVGEKINEKPEHCSIDLPVEKLSVRAPVHYQRIQNIRSIVSHYRIAAVFWIPVEDAYRPTWTYSQAVLTTPAGMILIRYGTATMIFFVEIQQLTGTDFDTAAAADAELVIYFKFCNIDHSLKKPAVRFQRCRYI